MPHITRQMSLPPRMEIILGFWNLQPRSWEAAPVAPQEIFAVHDTYVYSSQALHRHSPSPFNSTACAGEDPLKWIEAVRLHGAEGMLSSAAVHTTELPASMAWVTARGQLTFGSLDHQISLRAQRRSEPSIVLEVQARF